MNITPETMAYFGEMKHGHPTLTKLSAARLVTHISILLSTASLIASATYALCMSLLIFFRSTGFHYRSNPFMSIWPCALINTSLSIGILLELFVFGGWFSFAFRHATGLRRLRRRYWFVTVAQILLFLLVFLLCLSHFFSFIILHGYDGNYEWGTVFTWVSSSFLSCWWLLLLLTRWIATSARTRRLVIEYWNRFVDDEDSSDVRRRRGRTHHYHQHEQDDDEARSLTTEHASIRNQDASTASSTMVSTSSTTYYSKRKARVITLIKRLHLEDYDQEYMEETSLYETQTVDGRRKWRHYVIHACLFCFYKGKRLLGWIVRLATLIGIILMLIMTLNNVIDRLVLSRAVDPVPGRMIRLAHGQRMHLICQGPLDGRGGHSGSGSGGSGGPAEMMNDDAIINNITLVLETDIGQVSEMNWFLLTPMLSNHVRTCFYDRSGYGWSHSGHFPRTGSVIASELNQLLRESGELDNGKQIVLAGHGWGAQFIRIYQSMYGDHVSGLIFIDGASDNITRIDASVNHHDSVKRAMEKQREDARFYKRLAIFEPFGLTHILLKYHSYYTSLYEANRGRCPLMCPSRTGQASIYNNRWSLSVWSEVYNRHLTEDMARNLTHHGDNAQYLGDLPVAVFSAGGPINGTCDFGGRGKILKEMGIIENYEEYCEQYRRRLETWGPIHYHEQHRLTQLSSNTEWKIFWDSRTFIQWDQPELLSDGIIDLVKKAQRYAAARSGYDSVLEQRMVLEQEEYNSWALA